MANPQIDPKVIKILAERFILTFEQAETLYIAYPFCGSADEGVEAAYNAYEKEELYGIGKGVIKQVFKSLDNLSRMIKEDEEGFRLTAAHTGEPRFRRDSSDGDGGRLVKWGDSIPNFTLSPLGRGRNLR